MERQIDMNSKQRGFSVVAVVALLAIVLLVVAGAYVWSQRTQDEEQVQRSQTQATKTYRDTAQRFTFNYPEDWIAINPPPCCEGEIPDPAVTSSVVHLLYPGAAKMSNASDAGDSLLSKNTVHVMHGEAAGREQAYPDKFKDAQKSLVNGYELLAAQSAEQYGYRDAYYLITDGNQDLVFVLRTKQTAKAGLDAATFDASATLPTIEQIIETVKFL